MLGHVSSICKAALLLSLSVGFIAPAFARLPAPPRDGMVNETPKELQDIGIKEHLGDRINLGLTYKNEDGKDVRLADYFQSGKPVLLSLAYYSCPNLCNLHMNGLKDVFMQMKGRLGHDFQAVVVSIDPSEKPELAKAKKTSYAKAMGSTEAVEGWHFLTGDEAAIRELAQQVGFSYRWDPAEKQWAHAAAAYVITPNGEISRYLYGILFDPKTLRLSLVEASKNKIGTLVDKLTLFCFHYDPKENKYTLAAMNLMRAGGALAVLIMAAFLTPFWFRQRRESSSV